MKNKLLLVLLLVAGLLLTGCNSILDNILPTPGNKNFQPTAKISYDALVEGVDFKAGEVLVRLGDSLVIQDTLNSLQATILQRFDEVGWALVRVPAGKTTHEFLRELANQKVVIMAEPNMLWELPQPQKDLTGVAINTTTEPDAEDYDKLWGMRNIKADKAWNITTGDSKVIVVIADTGMDTEHPEFAEHEIIEPHNTTGDSYGAYDLHGHGTHVAGTAAADGRYGKLAGVVWDCPIMPIRVMDTQGYMFMTYIGRAMIDAAIYVMGSPEYRAVVNMSLGGPGYSYFFKDCIDLAYEAGVLLVAAAGNDYKRVLGYPSAYNGVVSVAATTPQDKKAGFSSTGFWNSVAAPGVEIYSAYPTYFSGADYQSWQGTSMACPHVCGAAALLLSHNPDLTPLEIKNQLEETARPSYYGSDFNEKVGYGIIDCEALLGSLKPMKYGSLLVETEVCLEDDDEDMELYDYGMVTIFDANDQVAYFGATGINGCHNFPALLPGNYTVTLSYNGMVHDSEEFTITAGCEKTITLDLLP